MDKPSYYLVWRYTQEDSTAKELIRLGYEVDVYEWRMDDLQGHLDTVAFVETYRIGGLYNKDITHINGVKRSLIEFHKNDLRIKMMNYLVEKEIIP